MRLLLASASPRRAELLTAAGFEFESVPVGVDENRRGDEHAAAYVQRLAEAKADAAARRHPGAVVIGADTAVVTDRGEILGKPATEDDAARMLRLLVGRTHHVMTGVAVVRDSQRVVAVEDTKVTMDSLTDEETRWYLDSCEWSDKAGGYGAQGYASRFVSRIDGSYSNVVGLPI